MTQQIRCRGVRGATTVSTNNALLILRATQELLETLIHRNKIEVDDITSVIFSATADLTTVFPALAARQMGWHYVPMLCTQELDVPGALPHCIRVLLHWNTVRSPYEIIHIYLHDAVILRPDWGTNIVKHSLDPDI